MENSLISIIIPVYNVEKYLHTCLDSVINQTYKNIEIICINDGSTDSSLKILNEYKQKDSRIKIIDIKNHGVSFARNIGIQRSSGSFIVFIDSDDYINPEFCENSYNNQQKTNSDLVCGRKILLDSNGKEKRNWVSKRDISYYPMVEYDLFTQYHMVTDKLFKTKIIKENKIQFDTKLDYGEDSLFLTQYLIHCNIITSSHDSNYIVHENNISLSRNSRYKERIKRQRKIVLAKNKKMIDDYKKKHPPLVSIILTLYEIKPLYLNQCLKSILNQTYKNVEIIAVNDCSPKTNYDYITKLSNKIKLYKNEVNLGMNKTVSKAFKLAKGKYIMRLGSDDYFSPKMIEKEVKMLEENPEIGATCCELKRFGQRTQIIKRPKEWILKDVLDGHIDGAGYAGGMMFRSTLLDKCTINENYRMCEDLDFHIQILEHMPIKSIHQIMYFYRSHETNICKSVSNDQRLGYIREILKNHNEKYKECHPELNKA